MGGIKVWSILILLLLLGVVRADISTLLMQYVSPPTGSTSPVTATFKCYYNVSGGSMVTNATVFVNITSLGGFTATAFYPTDGTSPYYRLDKQMPVGTYTWDCVAAQLGYQLQIGARQTYVVNPKPAPGPKPPGKGGCTTPPCPLEQVEQPTGNSLWSAAIAVIAIIGLGIGYFVMKSALTVSADRGSKKKK